MNTSLPDYIVRAGERNAHPFHMWDGIQSIPETLSKTLEAYRDNPYAPFGKVIAGKKYVYFTGCGTSYYNGIAARYVFREIAGMNSSAEYALEFLNYPPLYSENDACVGISHTGGTAAVIEALRRFKSIGGYTLGITDVADSPLTKTVDGCLAGASGREPALPKTRSYTAALLKLFLLAADVADAKKLDTRGFREGILKTPELSAKTLAGNEQLVKSVAANNYNKMYIFGSGINLATIHEGALKLSEAAQIVAISLQLEEGMHGPWVTMNKGDLVVVLNFGESNRTKCEKLMESLGHIGVDILNITDDDSSHGHEKYRINIPAPEAFTAFYSVLPLYQLTYFTALNNCKNPDFMRLWEENYLKTRLSLPR